MISCTEFIPCYSELFSFLDKKYGYNEVENFWSYLFEPTGDGIPLINYLNKEGLKGCWSYWAGTLNEEAADFEMYFNEKRGYFHIKMNRCPSKGKLLQLENEIGLKPYPHYCLHCNYYKDSVEKLGYKYIYNFVGTDEAACSILIYDPEVFDGRVIVDNETLIMKRNASENEYFHPDFHSSMNMGIEYLGSKYGDDEVVEFLQGYTKAVYNKVIKKIKQNGLVEIKKHIEQCYKNEKASDAIQIDYTDDRINVNVKYCPVVKYLLSTGREVSDWYNFTTTVVMQTLCDVIGYSFELHSYDKETGASKYTIKK